MNIKNKPKVAVIGSFQEIFPRPVVFAHVSITWLSSVMKIGEI